MAERLLDLDPLPANFPQTFLPDRRLLASLLPFAARNGTGTKVEIGAETGIPTGESTGKVEPMIHFARGMGLIRTGKEEGGRWQLTLSLLGEVVLAEDPYLGESVTLWLLHLLLCRRHGLTEPAKGIADPWFALFAEGEHRLGSRFEANDYHEYLIQRHGEKSYTKSLAGLVPRTYQESACFGDINVLVAETDGKQSFFRRCAAPTDPAFFPAYATYLFLAWDLLYPDHDQLAIDELFQASRCLAVMHWDRASANTWLDWLADRGYLQLDRQTGGTLALRLAPTTSLIKRIYEDLI